MHPHEALLYFSDLEQKSGRNKASPSPILKFILNIQPYVEVGSSSASAVSLQALIPDAIPRVQYPGCNTPGPGGMHVDTGNPTKLSLRLAPLPSRPYEALTGITR